MSKKNRPKVLLLDIEISPLLASVWALFDQNVGLNQIQRDTFILSFSAKWLDSDKVIYMDQSRAKDIEDDSTLLKAVWKLLDEADIVIGQNSKRFDIKRLNARFIINGMQPPSSFKQVDTLELAKRNFAFTSNKLEYLSSKLCTKHKKLTKRKYAGFELWKECLKGNKAAWKEMREYNTLDVLSLQELYEKLAPWGSPVNFELYSDEVSTKCNCGSEEFTKNGFKYTSSGKFQRFKCISCGAEHRDKKNLFTREKRASLGVK